MNKQTTRVRENDQLKAKERENITSTCPAEVRITDKLKCPFSSVNRIQISSKFSLVVSEN